MSENSDGYNDVNPNPAPFPQQRIRHGYVIVDSDDMPLYNSFSVSAEQARYLHCWSHRGLDNSIKPWSHFRTRGFRVVPAVLTVEDITVSANS